MSKDEVAGEQQNETGGDAMVKQRGAVPVDDMLAHAGQASVRPRRPRLVIDYNGIGDELGGHQTTVEELKRSRLAMADLQIVVNNEAEQFAVVWNLLKKMYSELLNRRGERYPEIGPVIVAFDSETMAKPGLMSAIDRVNAHLPPVEVRPVWSRFGELAGKTWADLVNIEKQNPEIRRMLLREHRAMWKIPRMLSGCASLELEQFVFVVDHEVALNWAARGVAAIFAHPAFNKTPPHERWRLAQQVKPAQVIWVGGDVSDVEALDDFAEIVVVSIAGR